MDVQAFLTHIFAHFGSPPQVSGWAVAVLMDSGEYTPEEVCDMVVTAAKGAVILAKENPQWEADDQHSDVAVQTQILKYITQFLSEVQAQKAAAGA